MARMIPDVLPEDTASDGERKVYRTLASHPDTHNWLVLHSLDTARHIKQVFGEIDFVIIVPNKGVLCLEVKGVKTLRRDQGMWHYGRSSDARGPFKQASQAMYSLLDYVTQQDSSLREVIFTSAVNFPFIEFSEASPEWHRWQVIDQRALASLSLPQLIVRALDNARALRDEKQRYFDRHTDVPSDAQCQALAHILRSEFEIFERPKARKQRLDEEIKRYTEEQLTALDAMANNPQVLFTGSAGTGKTLLALEAARRAAVTGKHVLLVCFNRFLGKKLRDELEEIDGVMARTLHSYMLHTVEIEVDETDDRFWSETLPHKMLEHLLETDEAPFDVLIIDEAQDIFHKTYLDVLDLSLKGGFKTGTWRIFGDFEKQHIYASDDSVSTDEFTKTYENRPAHYSMTVNCRNTPRIATTARYLGQLSPGYSRVLRPDNGVDATFHYYKNAAQQQNLLIQALVALYDDGFSGADIVILSPRSNASSCAASLQTPPWSDRVVPFQLEQTGHVGYCSVYAFKGLEADAVIITDVEDIVSDEASQLFYVGITRALHRLVIVASDEIKQDMQNMLIQGLTGVNA